MIVTFVLFIVSCAPRGVVLPQVDTNISPHNDSQRKFCYICHLENSVKTYGDNVQLCLRCHPMGRNDHPVDIPAGELKTWLPLSEGRIVCHTCHDQHNKTQEKAMLRTGFNRLCRECHNRK